MTKLLLLSFIILVPFALNSCCTAHVPIDIHDEALYYIKGNPDTHPEDNYAVQMYFLSTGENQISKFEWDMISQGMVALSAQAFDDFNAEIAKLCSETPCNYEALQKIHALIKRIHKAAGRT